MRSDTTSVSILHLQAPKLDIVLICRHKIFFNNMVNQAQYQGRGHWTSLDPAMIDSWWILEECSTRRNQYKESHFFQINLTRVRSIGQGSQDAYL